MDRLLLKALKHSLAVMIDFNDDDAVLALFRTHLGILRSRIAKSAAVYADSSFL